MKRGKIPLLAIVVPCLNEQEIIENSINKLLNIIFILSNKNKIDKNSYLYLVDDGSTDKTWDIITKLYHKNTNIKAIKFVKNYGMQKALLAGYENSNILGCDCAISIDADLQQDINSIEKFIDEYTNDNNLDIILGVRNDRKSDTFLKKVAANIFYILAKILGLKLIKNHADYRLVSKKALDVLGLYKNKNFFFRSFFINTGLKYSCLYFDVKPSNRKSKFNLFNLTNFALNSIFISTKNPLKALLFCEFFILLFGIFIYIFLTLLNVFFNHIINYHTIIYITIIFFLGLNIFLLKIIAVYIWETLKETDEKPKYIKKEELKQ